MKLSGRKIGTRFMRIGDKFLTGDDCLIEQGFIGIRLSSIIELKTHRYIFTSIGDVKNLVKMVALKSSSDNKQKLERSPITPITTENKEKPKKKRKSNIFSFLFPKKPKLPCPQVADLPRCVKCFGFFPTVLDFIDNHLNIPRSPTTIVVFDIVPKNKKKKLNHNSCISSLPYSVFVCEETDDCDPTLRLDDESCTNSFLEEKRARLDELRQSFFFLELSFLSL